MLKKSTKKSSPTHTEESAPGAPRKSPMKKYRFSKGAEGTLIVETIFSLVGFNEKRATTVWQLFANAKNTKKFKPLIKSKSLTPKFSKKGKNEIKKLVKAGIIKENEVGCYLTPTGKREYEKFLDKRMEEEVCKSDSDSDDDGDDEEDYESDSGSEEGDEFDRKEEEEEEEEKEDYKKSPEIKGKKEKLSKIELVEKKPNEEKKGEKKKATNRKDESKAKKTPTKKKLNLTMGNVFDSTEGKENVNKKSTPSKKGGDGNGSSPNHSDRGNSNIGEGKTKYVVVDDEGSDLDEEEEFVVKHTDRKRRGVLKNRGDGKKDETLMNSIYILALYKLRKSEYGSENFKEEEIVKMFDSVKRDYPDVKFAEDKSVLAQNIQIGHITRSRGRLNLTVSGIDLAENLESDALLLESPAKKQRYNH